MVQVQRRVPADAEISFVEHSGVIDAVKAGDGAVAAERMRLHLVRTRDVLLLDHSHARTRAPSPATA